jgi:hypothetical protein
MKRRQEALETGLQAIQRMSTCKEPAAAARIWGEWVAGSMNRILGDISDAQDHAVKLVTLGQRTSQVMLSGQAGGAVATVAVPGGGAGAEAPLPSQTEEKSLRAAA